MVPKHFRLMHLIKLIKKDISLKEDQTLYFFVNDRIIKNGEYCDFRTRNAVLFSLIIVEFSNQLSHNLS